MWNEGFPFLPAGCQIVMDETSQAIVLDNIRSQIANRWAQIVAELRSYGDQTWRLSWRSGPRALRHPSPRIALVDATTSGRRTPHRTGVGLEDKLLKRVRAFSHVDDIERAGPTNNSSRRRPDYADLSTAEQRIARMLFYSLWYDGGGHDSVADGLSALRSEVGGAARARSGRRHLLRGGTPRGSSLPPRSLAHPAQGPRSLPARGDPRRRSTSLGTRTASARASWYSQDLNVDAFFVTLKKSESDYSPTTMYADYPISPELFHWESQSTTSVDSPTGRRYLSGSSTVLIFARVPAKG